MDYHGVPGPFWGYPITLSESLEAMFEIRGEVGVATCILQVRP